MRPTSLPPIVLAVALLLALAVGACSGHRYPHSLLLADSLANVRPDSALALLDSLSPSATRMAEADRMFFRLLRVKASDKADLLRPDTAETSRLVDYYEHGGDPALLPVAYYYAGRTCIELQDPVQALEYFQQAADALRPHGDDALASCVYSQMGYLYYFQQLYDESQRMHQQAYHHARLANDTTALIYSLRDIAVLLEAHDKHQESLDSLHQAHRIAKEAGNQYLTLNLESYLAAQYQLMGDYAAALRFMRNPLKHIDQLDSSAIYSGILSIYRVLGQEDSVLYYCHQIERVGKVYAKDSAYKFMSQIYYSRKDPRRGDYYYQKHLLYEDSVRKITKTEATAKVNAAHEIQKVEKANLELRGRDKTKNFVIGIVVLLFAFITVGLLSLFHVFRRRHGLTTARFRHLGQLRQEENNRFQTYITDNNKRFHELEGQIDQLDHEKEELRRLLERERERLLPTDFANAIGMKTKDEARQALMSSVVYQRFYLVATQEKGERLTDEDWNQLSTLVNREYVQFTEKLFSVCNLSTTDYRMCLLLKIGMEPVKIAKILNKDKTTIASKRRRLYRKYFNEDGGAENWDEFILML